MATDSTSRGDDGAGPAGRLPSIDVVRGIAMLLMALDHARDFWSSADYDALDLSQTSTVMFLTRWVTHLCAPAFMLLAGAGAAMSRARDGDRGRMARFLASRGLWLVVLELTLVDLGWRGVSVDGVHFRAMVIWALGWSMVALAALQYLPSRALLVCGVIMVVGHDALDGVHADAFGDFGWLWAVLHDGGVVGDWQAPPAMFVLYPLVPWIGVMAIGFVLGGWLARERSAARRRRALVVLGGALLVAFVVLRGFDVYGEPVPWAAQGDLGFTALSFLDVSKYPPSLDYLLVTGGLLALLLAACDCWQGRVADAIALFGRVPLFFYLAHLFLLARAHDLVFWITVGHWPSWWAREPFGYALGWVYAVWLVALAVLYPLCRWYDGVKRGHPRGWLRYL